MEELQVFTVNIHDSGDLKLRVGSEGHQTTFVVLSSSVRLASPVLHSMLNPNSPFIDSLSREFSFPEDDVSSFYILLVIAHIQFSNLPELLPLEELFKLAVLCDKYDAISTVRPWLSKWIAHAKQADKKPFQDQLWLFIAWVTGDVKMFESYNQILALEFTPRNTQLLSMISDYPHVTACFADYHARTLAKILEACKKLTNEIPHRKLEVCQMVTGNQRQCDMQMLSSIVFGLARLKLWPLPEHVSADDTSVQDFSNSLRKVEFVAYRGPKLDHSKCSATFWVDTIVQVLTESRPELLNSQKRHLEEQSKK